MPTKVFDPILSIKLEKRILTIAALYPGQFWQKWSAAVIRYFHMFLYIFVIQAMFIYVYKNRNSMGDVSGTCFITFELLGFMSKAVGFYSKRREVLTLEHILSDQVLTTKTAQEYKYMKFLLNKCSKRTITYQSMCGSAVVCMAFSTMLIKNENGNKKYPFTASFPFNPDKYYLLVCFGEIIVCSIAAGLNSTLDNLLVKLTIGTAHYSVMAERLRSLGDPEQKLSDQQIHDFLKACIMYQQKILRYFVVLQSIFFKGMFAQFLFGGFVICLSGFHMIVLKCYDIEFVYTVIYFFAIVLELSLICWYGQLVMDQSCDLLNACYETNWDEMSVPNRKMLILVMESCKRPLVIKAGGFFELNLRCLMNVLRSSYSYFAILRQVYNNDK